MIRFMHRAASFWRTALGAIIAVVLAATLSACGGSSAPPPSEGQATIGAAGGTVTGPDGVTVVVPQGALPADTTLRIARDATGAPEVGGLRLVTPIYQLTPHGIEFESPVRIRIPFDRSQLRSSTPPVIVRFQPGNDQWEILRTDIEDGVAAADSFGFSYYAIGECFIQQDYTVPGPGAIAQCPADVSLKLTLRDSNQVVLPQPRNASGILLPAMTITTPTQIDIDIEYRRPMSPVADTVYLRTTGGQPASLNKSFIATANTADLLVGLTGLGLTIDPAQITGASLPGGKNYRIWSNVTRTFDAFYPGCLCWRPTSWTFSADLLLKVVYQGVQPTITQHPANQSVTEGQTGTFTVAATAPASLTYQWQRAAPNSATFTDIAGATASAYTTPATLLSDDGSRYRAKVCTRGGTPPADTCVFSNPATLSVAAAAVAPTFTQQPQSISVQSGQTASFTAVASGTPAPSIQWYQVGSPNQAVGSPCASGPGNSTPCTYTTAPLSLSDNGAQFFARASNSVGSVDSNTVTLTVTGSATAPSITTQPANQTVTVGASATFTVAASGTAPLSYQWYRNGTAIPGANAASFTINNVQLADDGALFRVVISNGAGSVTSRDARLTVTSQPPPPPPAEGVCTSSNPAGWCWVRPAPHSNDLSALAFDGTAIHVLGDRTSMRSTDAGATWTITFNAISGWTDLAAPGNGVLVGTKSNYDVNVNVNVGPGVFRSTDNGQTWVKVLNEIVHSVAFHSATQGIAVGLGIWRTSDAGQTWNVVQAPGSVQLYRIVSPAPDVYVAIGSMPGTPAVIMRSVDGGQTWTSLLPNTTEQLADIAFGSASVGAIVTGFGKVLRTTDGGATWTAPSTITPYGLGTVAFADPNTVIAISPRGAVFRSTDGGLTWSAGDDLGYAGVRFLFRLRFRSSSEGYAVGSYGQVWRTDDAGQSWTLMAGGSDLENFYAIRFRGGVGLAAGSAGVWETQDGGVSWTPIDSRFAFDVAMLDNVVRVSVGVTGIRRSADRGQTWTTVVPGATGQALLGVAFVPSTGLATTGVAVGNVGGNGIMLRTTDSGVTWSPVALGTVPNLLAVAFSDSNPNLGFAAGEQRTLLRTTDGGATWTAITVPTLNPADQVWAVRFTPTAAFLFAGNGLYRSTDGGFGWTRVYENPYGSMADVAFLSATDAVAVGMGAIARSTDGGATWSQVDVPIAPYLALASVAATGTGAEVVAVGEGGTILRNTQGGAP